MVLCDKLFLSHHFSSQIAPEHHAYLPDFLWRHSLSGNPLSSCIILFLLLTSCTSSESCPPGSACYKNAANPPSPSSLPAKSAALHTSDKAKEPDDKSQTTKEPSKDELLDRLGLTGPVASLIDKGKELRDLRLLTLDAKTDGQESEIATMQKVHDLMSTTISKNRDEIGKIQSSLKTSLAAIKTSQDSEKKSLRDEFSRAEGELSRAIGSLPPDIAPKMQGILKDLSAEYNKLDSDSPDSRDSTLKNIDDLITSLRGETYQIQGDQSKTVTDHIDRIANVQDKLRSSSSGNLQRIEELAGQLEKVQSELSQNEEKSRSGNEESKSRLESLRATAAESRSEFFRLISLVDDSKRQQAELVEALEQSEQALKDYLATSQQSLAGIQTAKDDLNSRLGKSLANLDSKIKDLADDLGRRGDALDADGLRLVNDSLLGTTAEMEGLRNQMSTMQNVYFDTTKKVIDNQHEMTLLLQGLSPEKRDANAPAVVVQTSLTEMNALVQTNKQNVATLGQRLEQQLTIFEKKAEEVGASLKDARIVIESKNPCTAGPKKRYGNTLTQELTCGDKNVTLIVK